MRRIILALFFIFLFAINAYAQYQFDDEFNGSSVDTNAWALFNGYLQNGNNELQYYQPANVTESNGYLNITTDYVNPPVEGKSYTSGRAQTNTFNFLYGTVTVRALLPGGTGPWPAIWLLGADCQASAGEVSALCNWPYSGSNEIDMTEILDSDLTKGKPADPHDVGQHPGKPRLHGNDDRRIEELAYLHPYLGSRERDVADRREDDLHGNIIRAVHSDVPDNQHSGRR